MHRLQAAAPAAAAAAAVREPRLNNDPGAARFREQPALTGSITIWAGMASVTLISLLLTSR